MNGRTTTAQPILDALIHLTPLVPAIIGIRLVGRPALWLTAFLPLGPLMMGPLLAGRRPIGWSHIISTLELTVTGGIAGVVTFGLIWLGLNVSGAGFLIAVGILLTLMIGVNLIAMTAAGAVRALRGIVLENPAVVPLRHHLPAVGETGFSRPR